MTPYIRIMALRSAADDRDIEVGADARAAMLMPQMTVFVADRPWDAECTAYVKQLPEWRGDLFLLPPFETPKRRRM